MSSRTGSLVGTEQEMRQKKKKKSLRQGQSWASGSHREAREGVLAHVCWKDLCVPDAVGVLER